MSKRKKNPMPPDEVLKLANKVRLKKMAEAKAKLIASGEKYCKKCDTTKPLKEFALEQSGRGSAYCNECNANYNRERTKHAAENLTEWYLKDFGRRHYGMKMKDYFSPELLEAFKYEILARRAAKTMLQIDGKTFTSLNKFSIYVQEKYGVGKYAVQRRMWLGKPIEHAILDSQTMRTAFTGNPTRIKAVNTTTGKAQYFLSMNRAARTLKIGEAMLREALETGCDTRLYRNSKTKFTYKIYKDETDETINRELRRTFNRFKTSENRTERIAS